MKTTNQFDYPTATATNYKAYREDVDVKPNPNQKKHHYKQVIKQESIKERERVKQEQQKKKQQDNNQQRSRMREEIQKKKKQLEQLEKQRVEALESQRKAADMAKIKEEQDRLKRIQNEEKSRQAGENANSRFRDALKRLQAEKQENSLKERQAIHRRKTNQEIEKEEREKAISYKNILIQQQEQEKIQAIEEQKKAAELYRQGLGRHGLTKNIDYSKTCFHNPRMVYRHEEESQKTAIQVGQQQDKRQKLLSQQRKQREESNRQRSLERGEKAQQKLSRQREYNFYCRQTEYQQVQYNLQRIQAGKKNQYTGLKPITLNQMQNNKKIRSQEQFEDMFIKTPQIQLQDNSASKYKIIQSKYNQSYSQNNTNKWKQSQIDQVQVYEPKSTKQMYAFAQDNSDDEDIQQQNINIQPILKQQVTQKRPMAQTRAEDRVHPHRQELSYSQSEQDSIM